MNLKEYYKQLISQQLDEASKDGNPAPYGYKRVGGKIGKKGNIIGGRFVPVTKEEHEERVAKQNTDWNEVERFQRELHAREGHTVLRPTPWAG